MHDDLREVASGPGADSRQWVSYGAVEAVTNGQYPVRFNDAAGNPLPHGVLVSVKLQPSGLRVQCRVANQCAGNGEGEYHPFGPGDEVLVVIPQGDERAGCCIIGRLNQVHDVFPTTVAGQDTTQNNLAFKRLVSPYCLEVGQGWTVRSASTSASLNIDPLGQILINDGDGSLMAMTPDVLSLMTPGGAAGLQVNVAAQSCFLQAGPATGFLVDPSAAQFTSQGTLSVSCSGQPGVNHVTTIEAVATFVAATLAALAPSLTPAVVTPAQILLAVIVGLESASEGGTPTATPLAGPLFSAIGAALNVEKVPGVNAGVGSSGFWSD